MARSKALPRPALFWLIHAYGPLHPIMQYQIFVDGHEFFVDFVWPDQKLIVEFNMKEKYNGLFKRRRAAEERARETLLRSAGPLRGHQSLLENSWRTLTASHHLSIGFSSDDHRQTS